MAPDLYTLVRHSAYAFAGDQTFTRALETRAVPPRQAATLRRIGAVLVSYPQAEEIATAEMYPEGYLGLVPLAAGRFSDVTVDGLAVYLPAPLGEVAARLAPSWGGPPSDLVVAARSVLETP